MRTQKWTVAVALLCCGIAWGQAPEVSMPPEALAPPATVVAEWPAELPLPAGAEWHAVQTPNYFSGGYNLSMPLEEYEAFVQRAFSEAGWEIVKAQKLATLAITARKGHAEAHVVAYNRGGAGGARVSRVDKAQRNPDGVVDFAAQTILQRMMLMYGGLKTYRDRGYCAQWRYGVEAAPAPQVEEFMTAFDRRGMRFEWASSRARLIVHREHDEVRKYSTRDGREEGVSTVEMALNTMDYSPVKGKVPALLERMSNDDFQGLAEPRLVGYEYAEGAPCLVLEADNAFCLPARLWIGQEDNLLHRYAEWSVGVQSPTYTEIAYYPVLNIGLEKEDFAFHKQGRLAYEGPTPVPQKWRDER